MFLAGLFAIEGGYEIVELDKEENSLVLTRMTSCGTKKTTTHNLSAVQRVYACRTGKFREGIDHTFYKLVIVVTTKDGINNCKVKVLETKNIKKIKKEVSSLCIKNQSNIC